MVHRGVRGLADKAFTAVSEQFRGGGILKNDPSAQVDAMNALANRFDDQPRSLFVLPQRLLITFLLSDIFADACRSNDLAGSRAQQRIVPANEAPLARTCENFILVMHRLRQAADQGRKSGFHTADFRWHE